MIEETTDGQARKRRRGTERRAMDRQALVRLAGPLAADVSAAAAAEGLTVAAWLRSLAVARLGADVKHVRPSSPRYEPTADLEAISRLQSAQSMLNGAVIQLAKNMRETGSPDHPEIETVLADLKALRRDLTDFVEKERRRARRRN
jgi:hypothetical protein